MPTTLPQRLYLLSYTVDKEKFEVHNIQFRGQKLRAAALAELTLRGFLAPENGKVIRKSTEPPSDPFLAEVFDDVPADKPRRWLSVLQPEAHKAESVIRGQLAESGEITIPDGAKGSVLKPLAQHQVTVNDPNTIVALREWVRAPVISDRDPATVTDDDLIATVLAAENDLGHVFSRSESREHKKTLKAFAGRFDEMIPGLRKGLVASIAALRGAGGGWGT